MEGNSTMGRARWLQACRTLLLFLGLVLILLGSCTSAEEFSEIWYSNTHQPAFQKPFENNSIIILTRESGITYNGTALCLTQPIPVNSTGVNTDAAGGALVKTPVRVRDSLTNDVQSFETMFSFWIQSSIPYPPGQGLAFVLSPDNSSRGGDSGMYLGWLNDSTNGNTTNHVAVEFDTVQNVEFEDIDSNHVGVNINNLRSNCSTSAGYWDSGEIKTLNLTTQAEKWVYAWIEYDGIQKVINVTISNGRAKPERPLLSCNLDLSRYILLEEVYVGFTSSTGDSHVSQHSVYEWSFGIGNLSAVKLFGNATISADKPSKPMLAVVIAVAVAVPSILIVAFIGGFLYCRKYKQSARKFKVTELETLNAVHGPQKFSYRELSRATKSFNASTQVGKGGFGSVHKGTLPKRQEVLAVKRISKNSNQGTQEFVAEVSVIGRARHRNLVPLLGWCHEAGRGELLLVYEFMPNGSLDQFLFNKDGEVLTWERRVKILRGVGAALAFLHEEWEQRVVHRDVKASNVMLDAEFNARLGDFGLARCYDHNQDYRSTLHIAGTMGYMAPELFNNRKPTEKTDVYSFGVLALEIGTGISASRFINDRPLVDHVWYLYRDNRLLDAADPRLAGEFSPDELSVVLRVGLLCAKPDADSRPTMRQSLAMLKGESPLKSLPLTKPLPSFAFSLGRSESLLFTDSTTSTRLTEFEYAPDTTSSDGPRMSSMSRSTSR
ncbi:hypothetical protein R1flu_025128 [Riccia fluitans]|uniref:non-specific serine/threonine protein kinase n=1 Tax=Riccia fluitans TaxID=41844 RepID=A0ABD1XZX4_9MARC